MRRWKWGWGWAGEDVTDQYLKFLKLRLMAVVKYRFNLGLISMRELKRKLELTLIIIKKKFENKSKIDKKTK